MVDCNVALLSTQIRLLVWPRLARLVLAGATSVFKETSSVDGK